MHVVIRETKKIPLKKPVIIEGFPGIGMVGNICASYLAEKLKMELVGSMHSPHFPPISAIHDYKPVSPARIYASRKHNLLVLFSEFVIPAETVYGLSNAILDLAKAKKASALYSLAAIAQPEPNDTIYGVASTDRMSAQLKRNGVELIREGATQGVSGVLIAECAARNVDAANLLVQSAAPLDPRASARLLEKLAVMLKLPLDTKDLLKQGDAVETRVRESMEKMKDLHADYKKFEQNPMYG
ncbi:proteasome assembly chaperone family protein [Candidatus Micrarchaeota archaeon]|nr:proteasome assembly chaperone family protein [Candidatus Micrarchaeota archaeon]